jgi:predicted RNase H-like HicB family nuclease
MREGIVELKIAVTAILNKKTGLLVAFSEDLKGLMVPGRTPDEIKERLPIAIRELLEAMGKRVVSVDAVQDTDDLPSEFVHASFVASAALQSPA